MTLARAFTALTLTSLLFSSTVLAQATAPATDPKATTPESKPVTSDKTATITMEPGQGVTIATTDGRYSLNLRGRVQLRDTLVTPRGKWTNELNIKTLRLFLSGNLLSTNIKYFLQLGEGGADFDPKLTFDTKTSTVTNLTPLLDAFVDITYWRDLNIRVGQFFVPFDRARTIRESALQLVDRQQVVTELSLDRDVGLRLYSDDVAGLKGLVGYSVGVFGGDGRNRFGGGVPGLLYTARLQIKPFGLFDDDIEGDVQRLAKPRLAVGGAVAYNQHTDRAQSTLGNVLTLGRINYLHGDADLVFKFAGFSLLGEYLWRHGSPDSFTGPKPATGSALKEWSRNGWGFVAQAGYMIIDQLEVVGRYDQLFTIGRTDPALVTLASQSGREAGGGVNVYLNKHQFKIQADYFRYWGPSKGGERSQVRLQLDVSI
jgi:hypothetical protein